MAMNDQAIGAARFSISIDGVELGRFAYLATETAPGGGARNLEPHELSHVIQQQGGSVRKSLGRVKWPPLVLKKGFAEHTALMRFKMANGTRRVTLATLDASGRPGPAITLLKAKVATATEGAKSGGDVAIEELVLAHEGLG
jgi:hypothetical protein